MARDFRRHLETFSSGWSRADDCWRDGGRPQLPAAAVSCGYRSAAANCGRNWNAGDFATGRRRNRHRDHLHASATPRRKGAPVSPGRRLHMLPRDQCLTVTARHAQYATANRARAPFRSRWARDSWPFALQRMQDTLRTQQKSASSGAAASCGLAVTDADLRRMSRHVRKRQHYGERYARPNRPSFCRHDFST